MSERLPEGWKWVRLGEVCEKITDGTHHTPHYVKEGIPFLSVKNVRETGLDFENVQYIREEEHKELIKRCYPQRGDVLYTKVGTTGIAKAVDTDREFSIFVSVALLRPERTKIIPEYLERVLNSPICKEQAKALTQGVGNQNLVIKDLKQIEFPLPPLPEQKRIATKLQELMQEVERARTACEKQLEAVKALPSAYLREVFESEEAKKWERKKLGEVCMFRKGKKPRKIYEELGKGYLPYILIESFNGAYQKFTDDESCPKCTKEDVLLVWDGARAGLCTIGLEGCIGSTICALRSNHDLYPEYLFWFIRSHYKDLNNMVRGTGIPHLEKDYVYSLDVPLPPLREQRRIATYLKEKMAYVEKLKVSIEKQLEAINALSQAILRKAFRGEL